MDARNFFDDKMQRYQAKNYVLNIGGNLGKYVLDVLESIFIRYQKKLSLSLNEKRAVSWREWLFKSYPDSNVRLSEQEEYTEWEELDKTSLIVEQSWHYRVNQQWPPDRK
ncbi:hypothetical protein APICC_01272 [Apis cerana cerana]|uniref:Uncharacterized protein n=1 Tax=Apis cerana cerana TaxID=94128 RepID=A0A2A3EN69_APICC|nr:hypothetical protein APICC_01272 [Apis cerana cerana]